MSLKAEDAIRNLIKSRGSLKGRLTNFKKYVNSLQVQEISQQQRAELKLRLQGVTGLYTDFNDIQNKIDILISDSEIEQQLEIRDSFECDYYGVLAQAQCKLGESQENNSSNTSNLQCVKLPTISLPTFDGSYEHWLEFRDTFLSLVHKSKDIPNIQKFHYLKSSLQGSAQLVINSLEFSADNYTIAWEILMNRYNNNRLLVHNHVKSLFSIQTLNKESPVLLRKLIDNILKNLRALKLLGEPTESWDTLIIYLIVSKLDPTTEREWEQHKSTLLSKYEDDSKSSLTIDDLLKFLRSRADILETLIVSHNRASTHARVENDKRSSSAHNYHKLNCNVVTNRPAQKTTSSNNTRHPSCLMCNAPHFLYSCQKFIDLTLEDKLKFIHNKHLCDNCLRLGHTVSECRFGACRHCNKKHNSLLHRDNVEVNKRAVSLHTLSGARPTAGAGAGAPSPDTSAPHRDDSCQPCYSLHVNSSPVCNSSRQSPSIKPVLLSTAIVKVADNFGIYHQARALLDNGSERSFIRKYLYEKLNAKSIQSIQQIKGVGNSITKSTQSCEIELKSMNDTFSARINCIILPQITSSLPSVSMIRSRFQIPRDIQLADPTFFDSQSVDLLLGADLFWDLLKEGIIRLDNGPFLQNTKLGWIISGPIEFNTKYANDIYCNFTQSSDTDVLYKQLRMFWELEELPISRKSDNTRSQDEQACEDYFVNTTKRLSDGRFSVRIPFKQSPDTLGDSYAHAKNRFLALEKRLERNPTYAKLYRDFIQEYIDLGHMNRVDVYNDPHYFLPHHGVFREHSITTKLRVVFDASAVTSTGQSLNDLQLVGAPLQGDLLAILLRFREHKFVACADVEKMFRNILLQPDQRNLQLILWRENPCDALQIYRLNTVTYGTASAPFLSCRCLKQLAHECDNPDVVRTIVEDFYVDDLICGDNDLQNLLRICRETTNVLRSGFFHLRKWMFNFDVDSPIDVNISKELSLGENVHNKTLGLGWFNQSDNLHFHSRYQTNENQPTKRIILSGTSQIFDPLGLISPTIMIAKILLQKLWLLKVDWDEPIPHEIVKIWNNFIKNLSMLNYLRIPRHVMCDNPIRTELHIFTDASQVAYGACAYIRTINKDSMVKVQLLCSKGKVAPITPITIPKLELCSALIGARLFTKIDKSIRSCFNKVVFWTDSTIVLGWLRMSPNLLKTYVQNRVAEIHELTGEDSWHHVRGKENPADLVSRGLGLDVLSSCELWWNGPQFLHVSNIEWADLNDTGSIPDQTELPEVKSTSFNAFVSNQDTNCTVFPFAKFSQFGRMIRAAAYMLRFIHNTRHKHERRHGALSTIELRDATDTLARLSQQESFPCEYNTIFHSKGVTKTHRYSNLNLFLDNNKLLRVGGRIEYSPQFNFDKKHPILIASKHHFTVLLFRHEHKRLLHAAPQLLLYTLRETWWAIGGRNLARKIVHECIVCARLRGKTLSPLMGNLPKERLEPGFPFLRTGVDYAGPVFIMNRKGRGARIEKAYISLFICFTTRAIHLELVSDLSTETYLLALKRFISRRGKPAEIYSDNGKNFVGLMNDFRKFLLDCSGEIKDFASSQSIQFHFIPPYSSHFGGLWEAGVKSCKHHLRRVVGNAHLTFEEFTTVLTQVEAMVNSRPLTPMSVDSLDPLPLSPAHFLIGRPLTAPVCADLTDVPLHRLTRYQKLEQIRQHFWTRWSKEYISELQLRSKWKVNEGELKPNTIVLIKEDTSPPLKWSMGRIVKTFPGKDGIVRVADIKTSKGIIRRAFSKICPLPIDLEIERL